MSMAPMSMVYSEPMMAPMTAIEPMTRPRWPATFWPPWPAIMTGIKNLRVGPTSSLSCALGSQPVSIKSAVRKPHAMKAPMLGMTMPLRALPKLATLARTSAMFLS